MTAFTPLFKTRETRLDVEVWEVDCQAYGLAHSPLFVGTDFRAARSLQATKERTRKKHQRYEANVAQRGKKQQEPDQDEWRPDQARSSWWRPDQDEWGPDQARSSWCNSWWTR